MKKFLLFLVLFLACSAVPNFTEEITAPVSKQICLGETSIRYCGMPSDSVYSIRPAWERLSANIYLPVSEKTVEIFGMHYMVEIEIIEVKPMYLKFKVINSRNLNK